MSNNRIKDFHGMVVNALLDSQATNPSRHFDGEKRAPKLGFVFQWSCE